ncbi:Tenascin-R,Ryncolin-2,Angiopoietin-related protein 1,Angiopoietin-related protein 6,Ficolin-1-A,Fibrinogen C domain-containing protein 1-A,Fibrinogen C domain-containing protein 1,Fibrinogen C domain-containing protein 1-B,Ryncolin-1,Fibroleukin,Fibrinogen-like protein 1,Ficolin-2,Tenascin,Ficolin-1,Fibrinogen-like protein A,Microfibril-associated glycoprotein 4,Ryncolin-3,Ryncolin-4 [Mytilus edulis]|uniref:Fibrinogen C-terminal domain-containing protein n=1 Tax=Mytilus edulis TaxID=6550 RepID=A0A8S3TDQ3_MYTED|nr:Tenascin-R,Ryncolin-2,Angiopoietin-related protein 1,Angiopoietin-related protein 6,Ficolin-1-A,Fibrinogen C domain-containing protein 1-A,Fibrinogen C domain-containing protein 1,Fibrinogen C domain-containing protein 1-B,Ryncolin-1,Fibroleukin,Fibrinogen-like protein 1,Ficolin-2,Tenascin,Ficolin-1,Fibrinogen-like protein A,Microfibril-associated glycoprotein 4,Ryncolin-3,Ryncolin-4 [Mytilus edulis]
MLSLIFLIGLGYGSIIPENTETAVDMPLISNDDVPLVAKLDTKNLNKAIKTYIDKTVDKAVIDKITELKLDKYSTVIQVIPENPDTEVEMPLISNDDVPLVAKLDTKNLNKAIKTYINKTMEKTVMEKFSELKLDILSKIKTEKYPRDCEDVRESKSGIYKIYPSDIRGFETYCDMTTAGGGWLVFQKRQDGSVDFFRNWTDYKNGFGDLTGNSGNSRIHEITTKDEYELYILMEDFAGETRYARYKTFYIGDIQSKFIIDIGEYSGNAGNSLGTSQHSSQPFSTLDRGSSSNCAKAHFGGWWYKNCHHSI